MRRDLRLPVRGQEEGKMAEKRSERGFAGMDEEKHREISRKGGEASGGNTENLKNVGDRESERRGDVKREELEEE